jgi:hypothetical protein
VDITKGKGVSLSTITEPSTATSRASEVGKYISEFTALYCNESDLTFNTENSLAPLMASGPQASHLEGIWNSHPTSVIRSFMAFQFLPQLRTALLGILDETKNGSVQRMWELIEKNFLSRGLLPSFGRVSIKSPFVGRLALKEEAAGKVRVFAMVDPWTQWALKPLHRKLFRILSRMITDGTFDQMKPLKRLPFGEGPVYSLDLSAATDRLPIWLQTKLISSMF